MIGAYHASSTDGVACDDVVTPTFAAMALLTGVTGGARWMLSARQSMALRCAEWRQCTCS
jgi:hypothetical protein